ncbi:MAG TPA: alpha/beta fold hydrolase [Candidatus Paceibacterota bacterium]|nr:alpha/beta fold hydrolase [Candidatus Paceibacterota bacterium]
MKAIEATILNRHKKRMPATLRIPENARGTFVLLHGIGGWKDQRVMQSIIEPVFNAGYVVVTFDAADGANAPDANSMRGTTTGYREDLEDVIAYIEKESWYVGPLSLGGHSLGGLVAIEYTARHPEIERLILAAPAISWREYRYILPVASLWLLYGKVRMPGPEMRNYWIGRPWLFDFITRDMKRLASKVTCPTLVVMGGRDGLVGTVRTHRSFASLFPRADFEVVPGATHTFHPHEKELTATIKQWLTSS